MSTFLIIFDIISLSEFMQGIGVKTMEEDKHKKNTCAMEMNAGL